jgi:hypothetical protein
VALGLLTKKEKAWFFLLCDYQPKINKLIFLVFLTNALYQIGVGLRFSSVMVPRPRGISMARSIPAFSERQLVQTQINDAR